MIQSVLYFALGVLCAGLVVMIVAPMVWRRAVTLTRRRIEASVPLAVDEILTHKDQLRAQHAMAQRRLEISVKDLRHKVASQLAELGNKSAEMRTLKTEKAERESRLQSLQDELKSRAAEYEGMRADVERLAEELRQAEDAISERGEQLEQLGLQVEAISLQASNREVDVAAREGDIDRLKAEIASIREQRRELERELRDAKSEARTANDALEGEIRKAGEFRKKNEDLLAAISRTEEIVERRERDLERLKDKLKEGRAQGVVAPKAGPQPQEPEEEVQRERIKIAELMSPLVGELPPDGDIGKAAKKLSREIKRDREKMAKMEKTIVALQSQIEARGAGRKTGEAETAALREQISEIAAEMINITTLLEGPDSPIPDILSKQGSNGSGRRSLADRVKALQKAAERQNGKPAPSN